MQIHRQYPVGANGAEHLGGHLGGDRHARGAHAAILARVAEVRHHGGDAVDRGALERIDQDQQLHQVLRTGRAGRLDHEHVLLADVLLDLDLHFTIGEARHQRLARSHPQFLADALRKALVGVAGKYQQVGVFLHHDGLGRERLAENWAAGTRRCLR
ncbi:hypothetical protein D3C71_1432390 [compost metagenome]